MKNNVVWIPSYPKSGNTWVHSVIRAIARQKGFPIGEMDVYKLIKSKSLPDIYPLVKSEISNSPCSVLKTHAQYSIDLHPKLALVTKGFCYILRNPLDVILSGINFTRIQYANRKNDHEYQNKLFLDFLGFDDPIDYETWKSISLDDIDTHNLDHALDYFMRTEGDIPFFMGVAGNWFSHVDSWMGASNSLVSMLLKYENLIDDHNEFLKIKLFFDVSDDDILKAVESINNINIQVREDPSKPNANIFYNKMASHYYLEYFSSQKIKAFLDKFNTRLEVVGYNNLPY